MAWRRGLRMRRGIEAAWKGLWGLSLPIASAILAAAGLALVAHALAHYTGPSVYYLFGGLAALWVAVSLIGWRDLGIIWSVSWRRWRQGPPRKGEP